MSNYSPIQVRFNQKKNIDVKMCERYQNAGNRSGTLRDDVLIGHALAQAHPVLYQMILAMAKANTNGAITIDELQQIMGLFGGRAQTTSTSNAQEKTSSSSNIDALKNLSI